MALHVVDVIFINTVSTIFVGYCLVEIIRNVTAFIRAIPEFISAGTLTKELLLLLLSLPKSAYRRRVKEWRFERKVESYYKPKIDRLIATMDTCCTEDGKRALREFYLRHPEEAIKFERELQASRLQSEDGRPGADIIEENAPIEAEIEEEPDKPNVTGKELVDENGEPVITMEAVHREILLNDGRIKMKHLMKAFDVKLKSPVERQAKFKEAVRELCTMENDAVSGRVLVLKQHYSRESM